jgi:hypothetical protein
MPFQPIAPGKKVKFTLEVRGPRNEAQGKLFKRALLPLLKRNATVIVRPASRAKSRKRKR